MPQDNRHVALYDLNGQKIARLSRDSSKSHHRMVTATCWAGDQAAADTWRTKANLFSAGFDRMAFGWWVRKPQNKDGKDLPGAGGSGAGGPGGHEVLGESKSFSYKGGKERGSRDATF